MEKYPNYWAYSIGCFIVWAIILTVRVVLWGGLVHHAHRSFGLGGLVHRVDFGHHREVRLPTSQTLAKAHDPVP